MLLLNGWRWLSWPAVAGARRSGALAELIGLGSAGLRSGKAWAKHFEKSRVWCKQCEAGLMQHRWAVVLGSGWLADFPAEEWAMRFEKLTLVDIAFSPPAIRLAKQHPSVELILCDATGCLAEHVITSIPQIIAQRGWLAADLLLSANMLSQIGLHGTCRAIERELQESHLAQLTHASRGILVSDMACKTIGPDGDLLGSESVLLPHLLAPPEREWEWDWSPPGASGPHLVRRTVGGWCWTAGSRCHIPS